MVTAISLCFACTYTKCLAIPQQTFGWLLVFSRLCIVWVFEFSLYFVPHCMAMCWVECAPMVACKTHFPLSDIIFCSKSTLFLVSLFPSRLFYFRTIQIVSHSIARFDLVDQIIFAISLRTINWKNKWNSILQKCETTFYVLSFCSNIEHSSQLSIWYMHTKQNKTKNEFISLEELLSFWTLLNIIHKT